MSNLEKQPAEYVAVASDPGVPGIEILEPREVPLGGPRAMTVRRTLPQRSRSLIGAWCFVDHYGPDSVAERGGMVVPPHPHTGLQTVSWLFAGEIDHRDSLGTHAPVRPGELNLMTAGRGIAHSEVSTPATKVLHGAQLWLALPDASRHTAPAFEHYSPPAVRFETAWVRVFLGSLVGSTSPALTFSAIVGAQLDLLANSSLTLPVDASFEHGVLVDSGSITVDGVEGAAGDLVYVPAGASGLHLRTGPEGARLLLIGGVPFGESIVMWWNFIGRTHEEIVGYRTEWQAAGERFGVVEGYDGRPLPAPELPAVRLKARG